MKNSMGESLAREWESDDYSAEIWDSLQLIDKNDYRGVRALSDLAKKGSGLAMMYLGDLYSDGDKIIGKDLEKAEYWLSKSSIYGSIEGSYCLAYLYMQLNKANCSIKEYEKLASLNYSPAMFRLGLYYQNKSDNENQKKSEFYFKAASKNGHFPSKKWLFSNQMEKGSFLEKFIVFLKKIYFTIPFVYLHINFPNSDRFRL